MAEEEAIPAHIILKVWTPAGTFNQHALIDSGAAMNVISDKIFKNIPIETVGAENLPKTTTIANNEKKQFLGTKTLQCFINEKPLELQFFVLDNLSEDIILGVPFLVQEKAEIDMDKNLLSIGKHNQRQEVIMVPKESHQGEVVRFNYFRGVFA